MLWGAELYLGGSVVFRAPQSGCLFKAIWPYYSLQILHPMT